MVGTGDRSEKIRTYNFPQNRLTDHRIGLTLHQLDLVMEGQARPDLRRPDRALSGREAAKRRRRAAYGSPSPDDHPDSSRARIELLERESDAGAAPHRRSPAGARHAAATARIFYAHPEQELREVEWIHYGRYLARTAQRQADSVHHETPGVLRPRVPRHRGCADSPPRDRAPRRNDAEGDPAGDDRGRHRHRLRRHRGYAGARIAGARDRDRSFVRTRWRSRRETPPTARRGGRFRRSRSAPAHSPTASIDVVVSNPPYVPRPIEHVDCSAKCATASRRSRSLAVTPESRSTSA